MQVVFILVVILLLLPSAYGFYRYRQTTSSAKKQSVPTVSLLIPARNETHAITNTLHQALALDYPRLEIIVLDDGSVDSTSEKIRSFAQDGVRFIAGKELPEGWVGKNWALHQLAQAASGSYIVFCDTNVILRSRGFNRIIRALLQKQTSAVSVLPRLLLQSWFAGAVYPLLHWVILTAQHFSTPHVGAYGGLMAFDKEQYSRHGGYSRYKGEVLSEFKIARDFSRVNQYRLLKSATEHIMLLKSPHNLLASRIRYLYPLYTRFSLLGGLHMLLVLLPLLIIVFAPWVYPLLLGIFLIVNYRYLNYPIAAAVFLPLLCLLDLLLLPVSIIRYRFGGVTWKDREIPRI